MPTMKNGPKPDDISPMNAHSSPTASRQSSGPSWSISTSWARNPSSDRLYETWMAKRMFSHPLPNTSRMVQTSVVVHSLTPWRRHRTRTSNTVTTCGIIAVSRNGQYEARPNTLSSSR